MENLRWIMLGIGLGVILLIYFIGRSRNKPELQDFIEPVSADEMPNLSTQENDDVLNEARSFSKDEDFQFIPSEINQFELNEELVDQVTASVDDGLVDVITSGASVKARNKLAEHEAEVVETETKTQPPQAYEENNDETVAEDVESYDDDLVVLHIEAKDAYFNGLDLLRVINHQQLKFGNMNIYHAYDNNGEIIFSMSNMLKPGHFEPEHFSEMRTPGVILFMQLSLVNEPESALDRMLFCADTLSKELDARLTSSARMRLTEADIEAFKKKANYFSQTSLA